MSESRSLRGLVLAAAAVVVIIAGALGLYFGMRGTKKAATHTVTGTFTLHDSYFFGERDGNDCQGSAASSGYDDIAQGANVEIDDGSGNTLAAAALGPGQILNNACQFDFTATVPDSAFYKVTVSHRGTQTYTEAQMVSAGWGVDLTLGS